ncbi:TPA: hypothetical protein ACFNMH_001984 [Neisseria elongata]|jgi:hypothetical protein
MDYAVFQAKDFAACGSNFEIQAAAVKQFGFLPCFGRLGVPDLAVVQLHFYGIFSRYFSDTARDTVNFTVDLITWQWAGLDNRKEASRIAISLKATVLLGLIYDIGRYRTEKNRLDV